MGDEEYLTIDEMKADVAKSAPELLKTFDWGECPEGWEYGCYCQLCRSYMDHK